MLIIIGGGHIGAHASASQPQPQSHTRGAPMTITAGQESLFQDMSKYVGHSSGSFTPVITLSNNCLLTYQHGDHDSWAIGDIQDCMVNHQDATMRVSVQAVVRWVCTYQDYFLLETPAGSLDFPTVDTACCSGRPYFLVGNSARSRIDPVSYRYGFILSTKLDQRGCIRGDITRTVAGYSGYGCFSLDSNGLFAMNIATLPEGSILLPIIIPYTAACNLGLSQPPSALALLEDVELRSDLTLEEERGPQG